MRIRIRNTVKDWIMVAIFYLLLFQDALALQLPLFAYTDELFALIGIAVIACKALEKGRLRIKKETARMILLFLGFVAAGLAGNFIYNYQPLAAVLIDLYTNMKFFLSIITGYVLFSWYDSEKEHDVLVSHARMMAVAFFTLLLADQFFGVFGESETRYGLRVTKLMYFHPSSLAAAVIFLISILTAFYKKRNFYYIVMCLCMLGFTLRSKALAGAAIYCVIFYFAIIYRKRLKLRHIVVIGIVALMTAGEQFVYYYIDGATYSARAALTQTSAKILKDYFPIGTGFGTFASASAAEYYSPIYFKYGLNTIHGLSESNLSFANDTFWPIIIGQTGTVGIIYYIIVLYTLFRQVMKTREISIYAYAAGMFIFVYLIISSTSEAAFNNYISIPLAMILGYITTLKKK